MEFILRLVKSNRWCYCQALLVLIAVLPSCASVRSGRVEGLREIYETPIPSEVRRNFDECTQLQASHPKPHWTVLDGERFMDIYAKKFLVVGMEPNEFGGVWVVIAVEGDLRTSYLLWLYDVDYDQYDLRSVEKLPESLDEELMGQLSSPEYHRYWR